MSEPETARAGWHVYMLPPIDFGWEHLPTVEKIAGEIAGNEARARVHEDFDEVYTADAFLRDFEHAKSLARDVGWEGDYRGDKGPRIFWLPGDGAFDFAFVWKQDNNGTTFVVSPAPLHGHHSDPTPPITSDGGAVVRSRGHIYDDEWLQGLIKSLPPEWPEKKKLAQARLQLADLRPAIDGLKAEGTRMRRCLHATAEADGCGAGSLKTAAYDVVMNLVDVEVLRARFTR